MYGGKFLCLIGAAAILLTSGCHQKKTATVDTGAFKSALDAYYQAQPICAWNSPKSFPLDLSEKNPDPVQEQQLDALADAGFVSKKKTDKTTTDEHHRHHRERVIEYSLTDKGKSAASGSTAGQDNSGAVNFCVGSPSVTSVDNYAQAPDTSHYNVSFHFAVKHAPDWTNSDKIKAAFPRIAAVTAGKSVAALGKLTKTGQGWTASGVTPILIAPTS
jgi:hypothetical protein